MRILVTGGAGYIGSHTTIELLASSYDVTIVDNLSNSKASVVDRIEGLSGSRPQFFQADICDPVALSQAFSAGPFDAVIHFAGLKAVGESNERPRDYYENNVGGTLRLLEQMQSHGVQNLIFSSSATVYGDARTMPIREDTPLAPTNPYGRTKWMIELILRDFARAHPDWSISLLRYFNPVGAHPSGDLGEDPHGIPNNLVHYIAQVAVGRLPTLRVFGDDYDTNDGTGVRDYIHITDLARGHLAALQTHHQTPGVHVYNLGRGEGVSVLQMLHAFERAASMKIPYEIVGRRPGDVGTCFADPSHAESKLGWRAQLGVDAMAVDTWRWQNKNPDGYP